MDALTGLAGVVTVLGILAAAVTVGSLLTLASRDQQVMIVGSGSMAPEIQAGDAVVVEQRVTSQLEVGDVVTFHAPGQPERLTTHRVVSLRTLPEGLFLQTRGDSNPAPDPDFTAASSVVGVVTSSVPAAGYWLSFYQSPAGQLLVLGLPLLLLFAGQARALLHTVRPPATVAERHGPRTRTASTPAPRSRERADQQHPDTREQPAAQRPRPTTGLSVGAVALLAVVLALTADASSVTSSRARFTGAATVAANSFTTRSFCQTPSTYAAEVTADQPSLYYRFDDASGTTATDSAAAPQDGTYLGGVTLRRPGGIACDPSTAAAFNGMTGYVSPGPTPVTNPQVLTVEAWFRTTARGGRILGFSNTRTGASSRYDRHLYLTSTGQLVFGVAPGGTVRTLISPASYSDGRWHHAAATLGSSGTALYVDGQAVASDAAVTGAQSYNGYWRVAYDSMTGWTPPAGSQFFAGELDEVAVYPIALTAKRITAHYDAARPPG